MNFSPIAYQSHVLIIGGGASGVLMAAHLLRQSAPNLRVTIIERAEMLGCGIAYGTTDPHHLLNTRVSQMSALPDEPDHFERWLKSEGLPISEMSFADRGTYGRYLASLLAPWREGQSNQLRCLNGECIRLSETDDGVLAELDGDRHVHADRAIIATGHAVPIEPLHPLRGGWDFRPPTDPKATVAIIGTGLSMVDHIATLFGKGHKGAIYCLSRRGLLPQAHRPTSPLRIDVQDIPLGAEVSRLMHWLRALIRQTEADGGDWRDVLDGLRPHLAAIWQNWSYTERARFLRHAASWWEVHRHRMPPVSAARISRAIKSGQLTIMRGRFLRAIEMADGKIALDIEPWEADIPAQLIADHVIDCRGIRRDPLEHGAPVIRHLLARGTARLDPLKLGLDTTTSAQIIDGKGQPSSRIYAIGPAARGALWEITAIPDIREQTASLARNIIRQNEQTVFGGSDIL